MNQNKIFLELSCYDTIQTKSPFYEKGKDTGIGNILFQIASCMSYGIDNHATLYVPSLNTYFKLEDLQKENTIFRNINTDLVNEYNNPQIVVDGYENNKFINYKFINNTLFKGYFEDYTNFHDKKKQICELFYPNKTEVEYIKNKYDYITEDTTCSIHIRGGQKFMECHMQNEVDEVEKYIIHYKKCIDYMIKSKQIKTLYVMTNDRDFSDIIVSDYQDKLRILYTNEQAHIDLWIISLIKNNIVSTSTLAWWGSYLNNNENKTIVYHTFFKRIFAHRNSNYYLNDWIELTD